MDIGHTVHIVYNLHIVHIVHIVHTMHILRIVPFVHIWFAFVHLGLFRFTFGLILVELEDFGYRVLKLENQTHRQIIPRMSRDPIGSYNHIRIGPTQKYSLHSCPVSYLKVPSYNFFFLSKKWSPYCLRSLKYLSNTKIYFF